jgi:hypothetical protein
MIVTMKQSDLEAEVRDLAARLQQRTRVVGQSLRLTPARKK